MSQVPQQILDRLGGASFIVRARARRFHGLATGLDFHFGKGARRINGVRITLDDAGKHTVVFGRWRPIYPQDFDFEQVAQHVRVEGVALRALFTLQTGIALD